MPALAVFYPGMKPWDWEELTLDEVSEFLDFYDEAMRERRARAQEGS